MTFSEPTLWKGSTVPITVYDTTSYEAVAGTWVCTTTGGATVGCNANGANVVKAEFTPNAAFVSGRKYEVLASRGDLRHLGQRPDAAGRVRPAGLIGAVVADGTEVITQSEYGSATGRAST